MGLLYEIICNKVKIIGKWPSINYSFKQSKALKDGSFIGLAIDCQNQPQLTQTRINQWVLQIKGELETFKSAHTNDIF